MSENRNVFSDEARRIREAVCIDVDRIYDSCADKDCLSDLRVYFTDYAQRIIDNATSVRPRSAEVLNIFVEVEKVPFNNGYYSCDLTIFFKVWLDGLTPNYKKNSQKNSKTLTSVLRLSSTSYPLKLADSL